MPFIHTAGVDGRHRAAGFFRKPFGDGHCDPRRPLSSHAEAEYGGGVTFPRQQCRNADCGAAAPETKTVSYPDGSLFSLPAATTGRTQVFSPGVRRFTPRRCGPKTRRDLLECNGLRRPRPPLLSCAGRKIIRGYAARSCRLIDGRCSAREPSDLSARRQRCSYRGRGGLGSDGCPPGVAD